MKRIGIFVFYDKYGKMDLFKKYLLEKMILVLDYLIIVINGSIDPAGYRVLKSFSDDIVIRPNSGYDAIAYKEVLIDRYKWIVENKFNEIVLFNDTFYGPIFPLEEVFNEMDRLNNDFWGLSRHPAGYIKYYDRIVPEHIQSYFMTIKEQLFCDVSFMDFWESMSFPDTLDDAINEFELKFSEEFKTKGYKYDSWLDRNLNGDILGEGQNPYMKMQYKLISQYRFPIIKTKAVSIVYYEERKKILDYLQSNTDYDIELIKDHISRQNKDDTYYLFCESELVKFVQGRKNIWIFGHGEYGRGVASYLTDIGYKINGFVVSKPIGSDEVSVDDLELGEKDILIVAIGKAALREVKERLCDLFEKDKLLFARM